mgnify:CR=1 FL=1
MYSDEETNANETAVTEWHTLRTVGEAFAIIQSAFEKQILAAEQNKVLPNAAFKDDSVARNAFLTLLPSEEQRALFTQMLKNKRFWPRIRTLVGAPPYAFLHAEDEGILRAAGISKHRVNMVNESTQITPYAQFGSGHMIDGARRVYRIIQRGASTDPFLSASSRMAKALPWIGIGHGDRLVMDVRITKQKRIEKKKTIRGARGSLALAGMSLPRPNEKLRVYISRPLRGGDSNDSEYNEETQEYLNMTVLSSIQRAAMSPVGRIAVIID